MNILASRHRPIQRKQKPEVICGNVRTVVTGLHDRGNRIEELEKVLRAINEWWDTCGAHALPFEPPWYNDMLKALRLDELPGK